MEKTILLASTSPRRRDLLEEAGYTIVVVQSAYTETNDFTRTPEAVVMCQAEGKALQYIVPTEDTLSTTTSAISDLTCPVIGADTVVVLGTTILGKPSDAVEAMAMLKALSGREHRVLTGVSIRYKELIDTFYVETRITFRKLTDTEIVDYVAGGSPMDKAGAYGLQDIGDTWVTAVEGSTSNVVGLPMEAVNARLLLITA